MEPKKNKFGELSIIVTLSVIFMALIFLAHINGIVMPILEADTSNISLWIIGYFGFGLIVIIYSVLTSRNTILLLDLFKDGLLMFGMIGTVAGVFYALFAIAIQDAVSHEYAQQVITKLIAGISIAIITTLTGAVLAFWVHNIRVSMALLPDEK